MAGDQDEAEAMQRQLDAQKTKYDVISRIVKAQDDYIRELESKNSELTVVGTSATPVGELSSGNEERLREVVAELQGQVERFQGESRQLLEDNAHLRTILEEQLSQQKVEETKVTEGLKDENTALVELLEQAEGVSEDLEEKLLQERTEGELRAAKAERKVKELSSALKEALARAPMAEGALEYLAGARGLSAKLQELAARMTGQENLSAVQ